MKTPVKKFCWTNQAPLLCSAPMHGITNSAQRQVFKKFGADIVFSEMVSSIGLNYENLKTVQKTRFAQTEKPVIIQIFGNSSDEITAAVNFSQSIGADGLDFNCGCPARNMLASGNGGQLLLDPDKLIKILRTIKKNTRLPVSLKTRIGFDQILPPSFYLKIAEVSGIDCLIIHGRTVKQMYRGQADWEEVKKISQLLSIPVIGSGDITTPYQAIDRIKNFTPAGIMIGRGALGQPWIFEQTKKLLAGKKIRPRFSLKKVIRVSKLHLRLLIKEFQQNHYYASKFTHDEIEIHAVHHMRKHFGWYFAGFSGAKEIRQQLIACHTKKEVIKTLPRLINKIYI